MASPEEHKRLVRRIPEDVATDGNVDLLDDLLADDFVEHVSGNHYDREEFKHHVKAARDAFPDLRSTVQALIAEEDLLAQRTILRGTHEGQFLGIEPTSTEIEVSNMVFTRVEDGQIVERWRTTDELSRFEQIGAIDPL